MPLPLASTLTRTLLAAVASVASVTMAVTAPATAQTRAAVHTTGPHSTRAPATGAQATAVADAAVADAVGKGPVGWDTYRQLGALPTLPAGVETRQFSSFDRTGGNADFNRTLRQLPAGGYVLAERTGPGEIDSIWTTSNGGDVTQTGNIHVVLDGKTVLDAPEQDVVNGKLGPPFVYPLVASATQSSGGDIITVPMPYRQSMVVWTDHDPDYYHVTYRTFADASGVSTFDPSDKALDVIATLKAAGTQDPKPPLPGAATASRSFTLAPGQATTLAGGQGPGEVSAMQLRLPQLVAPPVPTYVTDDGRAFGRDAGAYSQFTVAISPANQGVRLTRRLDAGVGAQVADVYVDGTKVAQWAPNASQSGCNWLDESVLLPAAATAGKSQITIRNQFVSSSNDFNEFRYWAYSDVNGAYQQTDAVDVGPNGTASETAHSYTISEQTWNGVRSFCYPPATTDPGPLKASDDILSNVRIQISFDGQQTVNAPLGEFFGTGLGPYPVKALMYGVDPAAKQFSAWWPMPYLRGFTVTLYNGSGQTLTSAASSVTSAHSGQAAAADAAAGLSPGNQAGYFHATSEESHTTPGIDHQYLGAAGWGKFVGVTTTSRGDPGYGRGYMEGDERVYVDGSNTPQIHGTGTEDFYEGGWYFNNGTFSNPLNGNPGQETGASVGCVSDCIGAYRLMLADAVPFSSSITFGVEHGGTDDVPAVYGSTAYWYARPRAAMRQTDALTVGDTASEQAHGYTPADPGTASTLTSTHEGNDGLQIPETASLRDTSAPVAFRLAIDPDNGGVVLRRTSDQLVSYQAAEVYVNGQDAGEWLEPLGNQYHRWLDDIFQLPASLTAGRSALQLRLVPLTGSPAWSAARYTALSLGTR